MWSTIRRFSFRRKVEKLYKKTSIFHANGLSFRVHQSISTYTFVMKNCSASRAVLALVFLVLTFQQMVTVSNSQPVAAEDSSESSKGKSSLELN